MILTVDLASKFSAVCVMDENHQIYSQFDSGNKSAFQFVQEIVDAVLEFSPGLVLVEDVPYGISSQAMTKPVTRLQGILIHALGTWIDLETVLFINPSSWQKAYPGVSRGKPEDRMEAARSAAEVLGYAPPDLVAAYIASVPEGTKILKKHTNPLAKSMTDYVDAYLMARWVFNQTSFELIRTLPGVQQIFL